MHKRALNELVFDLTLRPEGPILIKAGETGADPIQPDMSFVRTRRGGRDTIYLPGSSLKGVLRAHCERLARTVADRLACDPPGDSCARWVSDKASDAEKPSDAEKYARSCFACRIFGNTVLGSRFRIADAHPPLDRSPRAEERNGVAIDRVFGSVAVGPFNFETVTEGEFHTTISLRNFTLAQLGLVALGLRDLADGRVRLGFGKSRGLGVVTCRVNRLEIRYPMAEIRDGALLQLGATTLPADQLHGVGAIEKSKEYRLPETDSVHLPGGYRYQEDPDGWLGVLLTAPEGSGGVEWQALGRACMPAWRAEATHGG